MNACRKDITRCTRQIWDGVEARVAWKKATGTEGRGALLRWFLGNGKHDEQWHCALFNSKSSPGYGPAKRRRKQAQKERANKRKRANNVCLSASDLTPSVGSRSHEKPPSKYSSYTPIMDSLADVAGANKVNGLQSRVWSMFFIRLAGTASVYLTLAMFVKGVVQSRVLADSSPGWQVPASAYLLWPCLCSFIIDPKCGRRLARRQTFLWGNCQ